MTDYTGADISKPQPMIRNQCDGCRRGLPVKEGIHRGEGYDAIGCTKERYVENKLLIRSHTGAFVEARVGMIVKFSPYSLNGSRTITGISDDGRMQFDDNWMYSNVHGSECTLLHAPFVVGDSIEWYAMGSKQWYAGKVTWQVLENIDAGLGMHYRHADVNLRDAPDYKPEEKGV